MPSFAQEHSAMAQQDSATAEQRPAVRAPFRWLAGLSLLGIVVLLAAMPWVIWKRGTPVSVLHGVVVLPAMLWAGHRAWHAAVRKGTPVHPYWPFASRRVTSGYFLIITLISIFAAQLYR